ncbi:hypothetical protein OV079_26155 [Nannocystis pusilla]|uniref:Uncharacterized protein n=1 Tax=Nannocystis pusilla TaxID=889268 RepID=A0A9X3ERP5_9BACT|nr:hypothetical protein [Nannocystis pusilla]MCY1008978.1 hypothetical protein [Nannocystis pusilla]
MPTVPACPSGQAGKVARPPAAPACPQGHATRPPTAPVEQAARPPATSACPSGQATRPPPAPAARPARPPAAPAAQPVRPPAAPAAQPAEPASAASLARGWALLLALSAGCQGRACDCADPQADDARYTARAGSPARSDMPPWAGPEDQPASAALTGGRPRPPAQPLDAYTMIDPTELRYRLWTEPPPPFYVPPTPERTAAFEALMRDLLATPTPEPEALGEVAWAAGFEVHAWYVSGQRLLAAVEPRTGQTGGGAYLVRVADGPAATEERPVILQAPHAFHDLGTERIALALALRGDAWPRALFVNTVHRYLDTDGQRRERDAAPADPCHNPEHLFSIATAAALDVMPRAEVVQIHGFSEDDDPLGPAAVVSAGDRVAATGRTREVAHRLRGALGIEVALFPDDRTRLGATANAQGRLIRARGGAARFVHLELSHELRRRIQRDARALASLAEALRPDLRDPEEILGLGPPERPL